MRTIGPGTPDDIVLAVLAASLPSEVSAARAVPATPAIVAQPASAALIASRAVRRRREARMLADRGTRPA
jgi:hypothetical protein